MTLELRKDTFISFEILKERNQCYKIQKQTITHISHKTQLGAGEQGRAIIMGLSAMPTSCKKIYKREGDQSNTPRAKQNYCLASMYLKLQQKHR